MRKTRDDCRVMVVMVDAGPRVPTYELVSMSFVAPLEPMAPWRSFDNNTTVVC